MQKSITDDIAVREVHAARGLSTMDTVGRILSLARAHNVPAERIAVDDTGVGGGVTDRLREQGWSVHAVQAAARARSNNFANRRAELFWRVRELLNPEARQPLAIPACFADLCSELSHIRYDFNSRGEIRIEGKDALRARLSGSPDHADALALSVAAFETRSPAPRVWEI